MKSWPWRLIFGCVGGVLTLIGITPLAYLWWFGTAHNFEPLSAPISLKRGKYMSPSFKTDLDEDYQVDIFFLPFQRTPLDLDWKIVDESGALIQSGVYTEDQNGVGGNVANLTRKYRPKRGSAQRISLNIHRDVQAKGSERPSPPNEIRLHVGVPERGLEQAYGSGAAILWAVGVAGPGVIILLLLLGLRIIRPKIPAAGSQSLGRG